MQAGGRRFKSARLHDKPLVIGSAVESDSWRWHPRKPAWPICAGNACNGRDLRGPFFTKQVRVRRRTPLKALLFQGTTPKRPLGRTRRDEAPTVVVHDFANVDIGKALQLLLEADGFSQPLGMRKVRAENHSV